MKTALLIFLFAFLQGAQHLPLTKVGYFLPIYESPFDMDLIQKATLLLEPTLMFFSSGVEMTTLLAFNTTAMLMPSIANLSLTLGSFMYYFRVTSSPKQPIIRLIVFLVLYFISMNDKSRLAICLATRAINFIDFLPNFIVYKTSVYKTLTTLVGVASFFVTDLHISTLCRFAFYYPTLSDFFVFNGGRMEYSLTNNISTVCVTLFGIGFMLYIMV